MPQCAACGTRSTHIHGRWCDACVDAILVANCAGPYLTEYVVTVTINSNGVTIEHPITVFGRNHAWARLEAGVTVADVIGDDDRIVSVR